jgi:hypothetical protein
VWFRGYFSGVHARFLIKRRGIMVGDDRLELPTSSV